MKRISLLLLTVNGLMISASASTITLDSLASNTFNDSASPTMNIARNPAWAPALAGSSWISDGVTGDPKALGYHVLPNGTLVTFTEMFNLDGMVLSANLSVMADDTTSVIVNNHMIYAAANPAGGYPTCSADPIGCLASTRKDFTALDLKPYLNLGGNSISFGVVQKNKVSFGLDYAGSITTGPAVPEPASLAMIGAGLLALGAFRFRSWRGTRRAAPVDLPAQDSQSGD